jgi:hypothetical protein
MEELKTLLNPGNGIGWNGMECEIFFPARKVEGHTAEPILGFEETDGFVMNLDLKKR